MLACAKYLALNSVFHTDFCYHDDFLSQQGQGVKVGRWSRSSDQGGKNREKMSKLCFFFLVVYNHYKKIHKTI